jgi:adenine-specific DNA-methyltransferase
MAKGTNGKEYETWSKEELIKEIVKIKSTTYGLVWHRDLPEEKIDTLINPDARTPNEMFPNEMAGKPFPVLKEVKGKEIESDKSKLVNLLIEGDNYHALAVLNFTHFEAIDLIYIDPPYNKGRKDFIYNDKIVEKEDPYVHSKWLAFMEKRLKLAKNLLKEDGLMLISIDDKEFAQLKLLADEIFGEQNLICNFVWRTDGNFDNQAKVKICHEYILAYAKNSNIFKAPALVDPNVPKGSKIYKYEIRNTIVKNGPKNPVSEVLLPKGFPALFESGVIKKRSSQWPQFKNDVLVKNGKLENEAYISSGWSSKELLNDFIVAGFKEVADQKGQLTKFVLTETGAVEAVKIRSEYQSHVLSVLNNLGNTQSTSSWLADLDVNFDYPKPIELLKYLVRLSNNKDAVILDFFAGSGSTAHAVLEVNKEFGGKRTFILCTNNGDSKSEHKIASEICYPRIKKVITGYKNKKGRTIDGLGGNLKYYTTDFVEAEPTDRNKRKLVKESTDMLCILENAFEPIQETPEFKIFKNTDKYVGVIFYEEAIEDYKKTIKKIDGHFNTYVFSMGDDPHATKFADVKSKVTLCAIPEVILKVYREIFK